MKSYLKVALIAILAVLPLSSMSAATVSQSVSDSAKQVIANPTDTALVDSLVAALKSEFTAQGIANVADIATQVMSFADDEASAKALAEALVKAAFAVAKTQNWDLETVATALGEGIQAGTNAGFAVAAVEAAAAQAAIEGGSQDFADALTQGAQAYKELPEIIVPSGDAGETPASDISTGTGVND